jgi:NADH:ubiquinone oxidoreductase subunit K
MFNTLYFSGLVNCIYSYNKNLLTFLIAAEVMFLGLDLGFIGVSLLFANPVGIIYGLIILSLTVGESAIGLSLCVVALKLEGNISFASYKKLKL